MSSVTGGTREPPPVFLESCQSVCRVENLPAASIQTVLSTEMDQSESKAQKEVKKGVEEEEEEEVSDDSWSDTSLTEATLSAGTGEVDQRLLGDQNK